MYELFYIKRDKKNNLIEVSKKFKDKKGLIESKEFQLGTKYVCNNIIYYKDNVSNTFYIIDKDYKIIYV